MFNKATTFNRNISGWDVSNVINMKYMFFFAEAFNQPLNNWNISSGTKTQDMFLYAKAMKNCNKPKRLQDPKC